MNERNEAPWALNALKNAEQSIAEGVRRSAIIKAYLAGAEIEYTSVKEGYWISNLDPAFAWDSFAYRVKEPTKYYVIFRKVYMFCGAEATEYKEDRLDFLDRMNASRYGDVYLKSIQGKEFVDFRISER